ncbi:MAG: discoidin domain-containing protein, partial [Thermoanaerobaculia bacterium]
VARGKPATESSTYTGSNSAPYITDGNLATFNHTALEANAWLEVDLGATYPVDNITLRNRSDCCSSRLRNFSVFVSEEPFASKNYAATIAQPNVFRYHFITSAGAVVDFNIHRKARYVRVQLNVTDYLHLRELEVWTTGADKKMNVAGGTKPSSSTSYDGTTSPLVGVDGAAHSPHGSGFSIFHTLTATNNQWFETDLTSIQQIESIDIVRRPDPFEALVDHYILISDVPFTSKDLATSLAQPGVSAYHFKGGTDKPVPINRSGRYVRVQKSGAASANGYIGFAEIRIWPHAKLLGAMIKTVDPE